MPNNTILTSSLDLANFTKKGIWQKNIKSGIIANLTPSDPELKTGSTDIFTFTGTPKAELVGEGGNKSSADGTPNKVTARTHKIQLTYRYSDEVLHASEDYQLDLIEKLGGNIATAISRALDLMAIHGINPATGEVSSSIANYIMKANNGVARATDLNEAAGALQAAGYSATGIAFDPAYAGKLARLTVSSDNHTPLYPELGFGFGFNSFRGLNAQASDTVSGRNEIAYTQGDDMPSAIMGDWNAFHWAISKSIPLHVISYGDPDGNGDLQRTNEIAIRAEAYISFAILDGEAFAVVTDDAPASI